MAITDDDRERAFDAYSHFAWDPAVSFSVNWSEIESLVSEMKRVGVDSALIPTWRKCTLASASPCSAYSRKCEPTSTTCSAPEALLPGTAV